MNDLPESAICLVEDSVGIYIPRAFARNIPAARIKNVSQEDLGELMKGPKEGVLSDDEGSEHYWEIWDDVLQTAILIHDNGKEYTLYQEGDLWAIPMGAWEAMEERINRLADMYDVVQDIEALRELCSNDEVLHELENAHHFMMEAIDAEKRDGV